MKVWKMMQNCNDFDGFYLSEPLSINYLKTFDGRSHLKDWIVPTLTRAIRKEQQGELGDSPEFILPTISLTAKELLSSYLDSNVEFLDLECDNTGTETYFVMNIIHNYQSDQIAEDTPIFHIKDFGLHNIYVSDSLKNAILENNIRGFQFQPVKPSHMPYI